MQLCMREFHCDFDNYCEVKCSHRLTLAAQLNSSKTGADFFGTDDKC